MRQSLTHALSPDVHAVSVNGDLVFLDVVRDSYLCLPDGGDQVRLTEDRRGLDIADPDLADDLVRAGLVAPTMPGGPEPTSRLTTSMPARSALRDRYDLPDARDAWEVGVALFDLSMRYRGRPFKEIVAAVRPSPNVSPPVTAELVAAVQDFHRWAPYAPTSAKCLLRAFMLLRFLQRRGLDALWVFGVRTWPFHAHCWLQCEDMVLDDQPDRIRAFTPILII